MSAAVPSSASGTVTPGMAVAQKLRRNRKMTITTSTMAISSEYSTSCTEAWMVVVRSITWSTLSDGGTEVMHVRQGSLDALHRIDHVGAGLLVDEQQDAELAVLEAANLRSSPAASTATPMSRMRIGAPLR